MKEVSKCVKQFYFIVKIMNEGADILSWNSFVGTCKLSKQGFRMYVIILHESCNLLSCLMLFATQVFNVDVAASPMGVDHLNQV